MYNKERAITLIALIITIIVMLILVGVTVSVAINGGLFVNAKQETIKTQYEADKESLLSAVIGAMNDEAEIDFAKLDINLPEGFTGSDGTYTSKSGNTFYVDKNGNIVTAVQVTFDEETVTLTPDNVCKYLGKKVANYKGKESVAIGSETYNVSTEYRLYYIDFNNKYKDGAGTIYLKAESTENEYSIPTTETTPKNPTTTDAIKIKNLNPGLYNDKDGNPVTPPNAGNENMKAVTWLTNTSNWKDLKPTTYSDGISEFDINYIVGAPSLEMMMDSYNTHYGLTKGDLVTDTLDENSPRVRLFYKYPYDERNFGYGVGPSNNSSAVDGYYYRISNYSVQAKKESEEDVGSMYYPGDRKYYWLASPSAYSAAYVMHVYYGDGGSVNDSTCIYANAFCPLVSLKSSVNLKLE